MRSQMIEMQKSIADTNMRMEEMSNSIFILQEMTKANKAAIANVARPSITIQGGPNDSSIPSGFVPEEDPVTDPMPLPSGGGFLAAATSGEYASALASYEKGNYGLAVFDFTGFVSKNPNNPELEQALYYLGMSYFQLNEFALAVEAWNKLLNKFPAGSKNDEVAYRIGVAFNTLGQRDRAKNYFDLVVQKYAGSDWAIKASNALKQ